MPHTSRADLSHAFCSYCGYPPMGPWRVRAHRVCMRCQVGVVLKAPVGAEPHHDDPFVIVNRQLAVQAVSRHAEMALSVEEPAGLDAPLEEFLICTNRRPARTGGTGRARLRWRRAVDHARATHGRQPGDPPSRAGHQLRPPAGRAAHTDPARGAHNSVAKRGTGHQREPQRRWWPQPRDMNARGSRGSRQASTGRAARAQRGDVSRTGRSPHPFRGRDAVSNGQRWAAAGGYSSTEARHELLARREGLTGCTYGEADLGACRLVVRR